MWQLLEHPKEWGWQRWSIAILGIALSVTGLASAQESAISLRVPRQLTLEQAESLLLQRNLAVAVNRQQLEAAEAMSLIAGFKPNPTLQLGAEQLAVASPTPGAAPRIYGTNGNAGANPTYTLLFNKIIERGGKREFRARQAEAQAAAARAQILDTYRQQLLQLRQAYGNAILARLNIELAQQTLKEYEQTEKLTQTRLEAGDAPKVELYRINAGKLQYRQAVLQAQSAYRQATFDVLNLLNSQRDLVLLEPASQTGNGEPPGALLDLSGELSEKAPAWSLDELKRIALEDRPDVEMARRNRRAAELGTELAQAQFKRDLSISTEYQHVGDDSSVGVVASFPLFVYNSQKAGIVQARALGRASDLQLRQAELQAITDVEKAWDRYQAAQQSLEVFNKQSLEQTERLRNVAFFSYRQGATSLFELLEVQRTLLQSRLGYAQARFDLQNSLWMLQAAIGRSSFED